MVERKANCTNDEGSRSDIGKTQMRKGEQKGTMKNKKIVYSIGIFMLLGVWIYLFLVWNGILWIKHPMKKEYPVTGIDVSHYQGDIEWEYVQEDLDITFAFIKATEGSGHVDKKFQENWTEAAKTDLYIGAYHFFSFDSKGKTQAENYIATVSNVERMLPPVVDVEYYKNKASNPPDVDKVRKELDVLLNMLEEKYGRKPIIYTTMSVYEKYINEYYNEYPLWIRNTYYRPFLVKNRQWLFWQYSEKGEWPYGTEQEKYVDCNVFAGSKETFLRYFGEGVDTKE